jgi:hypothetical protein
VLAAYGFGDVKDEKFDYSVNSFEEFTDLILRGE